MADVGKGLAPPLGSVSASSAPQPLSWLLPSSRAKVPPPPCGLSYRPARLAIVSASSHWTALSHRGCKGHDHCTWSEQLTLRAAWVTSLSGQV